MSDFVANIREHTPLVHCITNTVAANFAANAVIAVGGSPVMASDVDESPVFTRIASALTVNIGTCTSQLMTAINRCTKVAMECKVPWVLDPVGAAASQLRQQFCLDLLATTKPQVLRGNASEIVALATAAGLTQTGGAGRGLDSTLTAESAVPAARALARQFGCVVAVSGAQDFVVSKSKVTRITNGHPGMAGITATGCTLTAVLGCFVGVAKDNVFEAVVAALSYYAVAGELAAEQSANGTLPGTMHLKILDFLATMDKQQYTSRARIPVDLSLYLVTDPQLNAGRSNLEIVEQAVKGGVTVVQLREKDCDSGEFLRRAVKIKEVCDREGVPLIINDRVDIALAVDAAGVHIGQSDLPPEVARKLLGPTKIIGLSVSTLEEAEALRKLPNLKVIDYIGVGPVYNTSTKKDAKPAIGVEGLRKVTKLAEYPAVAIGGITSDNAKQVREVDECNGLAVVTAITLAEDPTLAAKNLIG